MDGEVRRRRAPVDLARPAYLPRRVPTPIPFPLRHVSGVCAELNARRFTTRSLLRTVRPSRLLFGHRFMSSEGGSSGASVTEGLATVYFPSEKGVFYNPPQIPNRDLSVLALRHFARQWQREAAEKAAKAAARQTAKQAKLAEAAVDDQGRGNTTAEDGAAAPAPAAATTAAAAADGSADEPVRIRVLDALTASGLRALRYVLEVPEVASVVANDLQPEAVAAMRENIRRNGLSEEVIQPSTGDAVMVMHRSKPPDGQRFEAVELDPYGTAAPFLDGASQQMARAWESARPRGRLTRLHTLGNPLLAGRTRARLSSQSDCDASRRTVLGPACEQHRDQFGSICALSQRCVLCFHRCVACGAKACAAAAIF